MINKLITRFIVTFILKVYELCKTNKIEAKHCTTSGSNFQKQTH